MAITKEIEVDRIEIVGPHRHIQVKLRRVIKENGVEIGDLGTHRLAARAPDEDIRKFPDVPVGPEKIPVPKAVLDEMENISRQVWTQKVKDDWSAARAKMEAAQRPPIRTKTT